MDNDLPHGGIGQELDVHPVASIMMQHDVPNKLLHHLLLSKRLEHIFSPDVRPNQILQCTRMKIVRIWYDDPTSLSISAQLLTTIAHTQVWRTESLATFLTSLTVLDREIVSEEKRAASTAKLIFIRGCEDAHTLIAIQRTWARRHKTKVQCTWSEAPSSYQD